MYSNKKGKHLQFASSANSTQAVEAQSEDDENSDDVELINSVLGDYFGGWASKQDAGKKINNDKSLQPKHHVSAQADQRDGPARRATATDGASQMNSSKSSKIHLRARKVNIC